MPLDNRRFDPQRQAPWPWRAGLVVDDPGLTAEIAEALAETRAACVFQVSAAAPVSRILDLIERNGPDLLFVELATSSEPPREWIAAIQSAAGIPLVAAVHPTPDPDRMIEALRAGAIEFLSSPMHPAIFDAMDRMNARLEATRPADTPQGRIVGLVSAKGGCGASTLACHLALALERHDPAKKIILADLDYQSPAIERICGVEPKCRAAEAFEAVRRLSSANWDEFFIRLTDSVDVLAGPDPGASAAPSPWRIESLFRHLTRGYSWVLADLGRHLSPTTWSFLQFVDELLVVSAPDVLALYQTRYILQTLTSRGFDRSRIRLVLNLSESTPRDFWIESVEQMFEMRVFGVIPKDKPGLASVARSKPALPAETPFGRSVTRLSRSIAENASSGASRKAA